MTRMNRKIEEAEVDSELEVEVVSEEKTEAEEEDKNRS